MSAVDWDADLTDERRDALVESIAQEVARRGMCAPAIMLIEMHKPISFLCSQALVVGSGFLAPFVGPRRIQEVSRLLESRANVERLIARLEELDAQGPGPNRVPSGPGVHDCPAQKP